MYLSRCLPLRNSSFPGWASRNRDFFAEVLTRTFRILKRTSTTLPLLPSPPRAPLVPPHMNNYLDFLWSFSGFWTECFSSTVLRLNYVWIHPRCKKAPPFSFPEAKLVAPGALFFLLPPFERPFLQTTFGEVDDDLFQDRAVYNPSALEFLFLIKLPPTKITAGVPPRPPERSGFDVIFFSCFSSSQFPGGGPQHANRRPFKFTNMSVIVSWAGRLPPSDWNLF